MANATVDQYDELFHALKARLDDPGQELLDQLDSAVGQRLGDAEAAVVGNLVVGLKDPACSGVIAWATTTRIDGEPKGLREFD